ncbi:MAG: PrsW family intramembrane metalloprotease [Deltaproteobacteria bacterium]|nr:MAG: PrsW family intramembrane metalloprotease [Deltaproteobacteria bacterium]
MPQPSPEEHAQERESSPLETSAAFPDLNRLVPLTEDGFFAQLRKQAFFVPALITVVVGLALLVCFQLLLSTKSVGYAYGYQAILGLYLSGMTLLAIVRVAQVSLPVWLLFAVTGVTVLLLLLQWPFSMMAMVFAPKPLRDLTQSQGMLPTFLGYFVTTGLLEELFKALPLGLVLLVSGRLARRSPDLFSRGRLHPLAAVLLGSASAVGFIWVETLVGFVPRLHEQADPTMGMMLLIPRLLTGICGHVAWSGILAYFLGLATYYRGRSVALLALLGWGLAAFFHGLWNTSQALGMPLVGAVIAMLSFVMFVAYLYKAKDFFSVPRIKRAFSQPLVEGIDAGATEEHQAIDAAVTDVHEAVLDVPVPSVSPLQTLVLGSLGSYFGDHLEEQSARELNPQETLSFEDQEPWAGDVVVFDRKDTLAMKNPEDSWRENGSLSSHQQTMPHTMLPEPEVPWEATSLQEQSIEPYELQTLPDLEPKVTGAETTAVSEEVLPFHRRRPLQETAAYGSFDSHEVSQAFNGQTTQASRPIQSFDASKTISEEE